MHKLLILIAALSYSGFAAQEQKEVIHPAPKDPVYLAPDIYAAMKAKFPLPPVPGGAAQKKDERELFKLQKSRTKKECDQANVEVFATVQNLYGKPFGPLTPDDIKVLEEFFAQVRNDSDFFIQKMKVDFPRQRPFVYISGLKPCLPREVTLAYPSCHATLSKIYALILTDIFPKQKSQLDARARDIGKHRVLGGMHHPSDIESGRKLGDMIFAELKKSEKYKADYEAVKTKIRALH